MKMTHFVKQMCKSEQDDLHLSLGRYIFATDTSFGSVNSPMFKQFLNKLNPSYKLPSDETIRTTILDKIYEEVVEEQKMDMKGKSGILLQDGWSTNKQK